MKNLFRQIVISFGRPNGAGLMVLLLLVVLVPSVCLLWFMNQAVRNERLAVRQKLVDAYRGHLLLAQQRLDSYWQQYAGELAAQAGRLPAPALFRSEVNSGRAEAVICLDERGQVLYPNSAKASTAASGDADWIAAEVLENSDPARAAARFHALAEKTSDPQLAARALQAEARCHLQAGNRAAALAVLTNHLSADRFEQAVDDQGRWIVPNARLTALELLGTTTSLEVRHLVDRLRQQLLNYDLAIPSAQRRFLIRELQKLYPTTEIFPTFEAEDLAMRYLDAAKVAPPEPILRLSPVPAIWQFGSSNGRVIALHTVPNLVSRMQRAIASAELPADVQLDFVVPGQEVEGALLSAPAGVAVPGWRLALNLKDQDLFEHATHARVSAYVWIGILAVVLVIALASLALGLVRRQIALTQLRNDLVANVTHELKTPLSSMRLLVETLLNSPTIHEQTAREYLSLIDQENLRLSRLIENFLTFSRIERNKYQFNFKPSDPAAIVRAAAAAVQERFSVPGCRFDVKTAPNLPPIVADFDAMVTALVNLLDNAFKYSGEDKQIIISAEPAGRGVRFSIQDNGIGLSTADTRRVFKRFYQVRQQKVSAGGSGLGLSIVQFIVTAHDGSVEVESEPDRGSRFMIDLPQNGNPRA